MSQADRLARYCRNAMIGGMGAGMNFRFLAHASPPLDAQLQWLLYSAQSSSFVTGDMPSVTKRVFAGSDAGGDRAASLYTMVHTAKLNGVNPEAYRRDTLARIDLQFYCRKLENERERAINHRPKPGRGRPGAYVQPIPL
jgi:hypothetical protein